MTVGVPPRYEISKTYPPRGSLQQYRLARPATFRCRRCGAEKTSKLVATADADWSALLCNGCYGILISQGSVPVVPDADKRDPHDAEFTSGPSNELTVGSVPRDDTSPAPRTESQLTSGQLGRDMDALAALLRERAEGRELSWVERRALAVLAEEPALAVALRYAELLLDGDALAARLSRGQQYARNSLLRTREVLAKQGKATVNRLEQDHKRRMAQARRATQAPDYLDALVMRHVGGKPFRDALADVLRRRGLRMDAIDVPKEDLWAWLSGAGVVATYEEDALPAEVRRLRQLDDQAFLQVLLADAEGTRPNDYLKHQAVVERWVARTKEVEARLREARGRAEDELVRTPPLARTARQFEQLAAAARAYARGCARSLAAELMLKDLRVRVVRFHRQPPLQRLRAECLTAAAAELAKADPDLAAAVAAACAEHRKTCLMVTRPHPCFDCASIVATEVRLPAANPPVQQARAPMAAEAEDQAVRIVDTDEVPASDDQDDAFVCQDALDPLPADRVHIVAVVEAGSQPDTSLFGFAWVTEDGELRIGTDHSFGVHDSWVQAVSRAVLDLDNGSASVHIVCRDVKAAAAVSQVARAGSVPDSFGFPMSDRTRALLDEMAQRRGRLSVYADACPHPHKGAAAAGRLAALALRAARGLEHSGAVSAEADRVSQEFSRSLGPLIGPEEEGEHAWWRARPDRDTPGRDELVWQTALYRMHLDGGWCALPDGSLSEARERQRLRLRLEHKDRVPSVSGPVQEVALRRRGGQWELHGIRWPETLLPGVLVTFKWRLGTRLVAARTALLPSPERVDEMEFLHRYDPQVVTREIAPGFDQDRDVPDLSDASWVLRTLRKLGYLSADGSATLAEDALIRNCLPLGLPKSRLGRIPRAVEQLLRSGRIERVRGSLDHSGRPWYPGRPGHLSVDLLRYVPRVVTLDPSARREVEDAWQAYRRGHWVTGFVRRLPPGAQASAEQLELHREAVYSAEVVDRPLPEGYTYVRRHRRGRSGGSSGHD